MKNFWFGGVALGVLAFAGSAQAADLKAAPVYKAPPFIASYDWTGFYVGLNAGAGTGGAKRFITGTGFAGGAQTGFNWQFAPQWVAGLEGDISYLGIDSSAFDVELGFGVRTDWYGTVRGRLGYTNGPSLFYATGGAAFVKVKNDIDLSVALLPSSASSETASGWALGTGIETMLGGNWSAKAEYLYIDAGSQVVSSLLGPVAFDNRFHVYRYGLNYKFGAPAVAAGALPVHNWNGFYAGVNGGLGLSQAAITGPSGFGTDNHTIIDDYRFNGGVRRLQLAVRSELGRWCRG